MTSPQTTKELTRPKSNTEWYRPGKSASEFHRSKAYVRILIGGRGSGKTTTIAVDSVLDHCWKNAGARTYILRKTERANADTTGETFEQVFSKSGSAYVDTGDSLFKKIEGGRIFRVPSAKAVQKFNEFKRENAPTKAEVQNWLATEGDKWCSFVLFSGVPTSAVRASRFRGFECSQLIFVEADQFDKEDVEMAINCLRWKSPDAAICDENGFIRAMNMVLDSNPPSPRHWIALWEAEEKASPTPEYQVQFWHIHTQENEHNLPPNYLAALKRSHAKNPAMYKRMVEGQYAEAFDGKPVLWGFRTEHGYDELTFPLGAYLVRSWDFGTTNATVFSAYWEERGVEYWWDLYEWFATQSDTETQCRNVVDITTSVFPYYNDRTQCAGVLDYCDPAGDARRDTGRSISVLNSYGIYPGFMRVGLQESIALYNRLLEKKDPMGRLVYRIDKKCCPMLYEASCGGYRYPSVGEPGFGSDEPLKGEVGGNYDHVADASRYGKRNALRLLAAEVDPVKATTGRLSNKISVNKPRKYY